MFLIRTVLVPAFGKPKKLALTLVEVPVVVDPKNWFVVLERGGELDKLVHGRGDLAGHPRGVVVH